MKSLSLFFAFLTTMTALASAATTPEFSAFDRKAKAGETLSVVFLGGSLTWGAQSTNPQKTSYRAIVQRKLEEAYPKAHFQFHDAAIGGTGSQLASFRLERDVLAYKPDLVFLDYTINDNPYVEPSPHRLAAYEGIVRRIVTTGAPMVAVILPSKQDVEANPPARPLDAKHKEIATAYGCPSQMRSRSPSPASPRAKRRPICCGICPRIAHIPETPGTLSMQTPPGPPTRTPSPNRQSALCRKKWSTTIRM